jgi:hypothetical protein
MKIINHMKKYFSLPFISQFITILSNILFVFTVLLFAIKLIDSEYLIELLGNTKLKNLGIWFHGLSIVISIVGLIIMFVIYYFLTAIVEIIDALIEIDLKTTQLKSNSDKILLLLESKFGDKK